MKKYESEYHTFENSSTASSSELSTEFYTQRNDAFHSNKLKEFIASFCNGRSIVNVLVPVFSTGFYLTWAQNKRILAFEDKVTECQTFSQVRTNIDLRNECFLRSDIEDKYSAAIFVSPCGWKEVEKGISIRLETEYIRKALNCLEENGVLIVSVPSNVLTAPLWQDLREEILDDYSLEMVVHGGRLFPNVGMDWYTLVINNSMQRESVYYTELNNRSNEIIENYYKQEGSFWVKSKSLFYRWDREYMNPEYSSLREEIYNKNTTKLGDVADIVNGVLIRPEDRQLSGDLMILTPKLIEDNKIIYDDQRAFYYNSDLTCETRASRARLKNGDIVISLVGSLNWARYRNEQKGVIAQHNVAIIRTNPEYSRYIEFFFESSTGKEYLRKQTMMFSKGGVLRSLSISDLRLFVIPNIEILEAAEEFQSIRNPIPKLKRALTKVGWDVEEDQSFGVVIFDLSLYYKGVLKGVVEVKNHGILEKGNLSALEGQVKYYLKLCKTISVYILFEDELFEFRNGQFIRQPEIPLPNSSIGQKLNSAYYLLNDDASFVPVKQLPMEATSMTTNLWLEKINGKIDRIGSKIDTIYKVVEKIANQLESYQSLVELQIDRAIDEAEIERIVQSFSDICTEKIMLELKQSNSEQERYLEERKLKSSFGISAWDKLDESSRIFLVSSKIMYNRLLLDANMVDFSGVCLLVTKALEVEMTNRFYKDYCSYLREKSFRNDTTMTWPSGLLNRHGKQMKCKEFTLGCLAYVLCYKHAENSTEDQRKSDLLTLLEFAQEKLFIEQLIDEEMCKQLNQYAEWIEEVRNKYRNPSAHTNQLQQVQAANCFELITDVEKILKIMLDAFKPR